MKVYNNKLYRRAMDVVASKLEINRASFLVTGATGLIGSCIADILIYAKIKYGKEYKIYLLGRNIRKLENRFVDFIDNKEIKFLQQDICAPLDIDEKFDYIIHAASNADPCTYAQFPVETILTNVYGVNNILDYCRHNTATRMVFTSTFEVYGQITNKINYKEDDYGKIDYNQLRACYPESKRVAEILVRCYVEEHNVDAVIARLCSIYGPTMLDNDSKAHAQFVKNAIKNEDIILKSEGKQRRTYCYLFDAVDAIFHVLFNGETGEVYNISNENSVASIAEVAHIVANIVKRKVIFSLPNNIEAQGFSKPQDIILDNEKLRNIGWKGKYSLEDGMRETLHILREIEE